MMDKNNGRGIVFLGIGFELVALCIGGYFLGNFIDDYMGWKSTASNYLVLALLISWFFHLFILLRRYEEDDETSGGENHDDPTRKS